MLITNVNLLIFVHSEKVSPVAHQLTVRSKYNYLGLLRNLEVSKNQSLYQEKKPCFPDIKGFWFLKPPTFQHSVSFSNSLTHTMRSKQANSYQTDCRVLIYVNVLQNVNNVFVVLTSHRVYLPYKTRRRTWSEFFSQEHARSRPLY